VPVRDRQLRVQLVCRLRQLAGAQAGELDLDVVARQ